MSQDARYQTKTLPVNVEGNNAAQKRKKILNKEDKLSGVLVGKRSLRYDCCLFPSTFYSNALVHCFQL